jgi:hypothetical protein
MSDQCFPCTNCLNKFKGNGPFVTQRTISNHLKQQQALSDLSTTQLIQQYAPSQLFSTVPEVPCKDHIILSTFFGVFY